MPLFLYNEYCLKKLESKQRAMKCDESYLDVAQSKNDVKC